MALTSGGKLAERLGGRPEAVMVNVEFWMAEGKAGHRWGKMEEDVLLRRARRSKGVGLARWEGEKGGKRRPET